MTGRILVVDDNPLNVKLLAAKLMRDYYVTITAENGFEAIEKARNEKPDLVLLDVMMPGMDGFETCRRLKADDTTKHIPVVIVTALSDVKDRVQGLEAGADDFLTKPINDVALMARVRSLLRLKMIMDEWRLREGTAGQFDLTMAVGNEVAMPARLLVLNDDEHEAEQVVGILKPVASEPIKSVTTMDEALAETRKGTYDCVIVSLNLLKEDGLFFCSQVRADEATRALPLLLLAQDGEIERVAKGLDLGANDYLLRPLEESELIARTKIQLKQKQHHDNLIHNYEKSLEMALVDPLTGAYNRRYLDVHLPRMFGQYKSDNKPITVMAYDIDFFKKVNDTYGHDAGDLVLKEVVNRITLAVRSLDLVARMGGEEFDVIMPGADCPTAESIAKRIREQIAAKPIILPDGVTAIPVTTSIGVASTDYVRDTSMETVLKRADVALMRAKETGRNRVEVEN